MNFNSTNTVGENISLKPGNRGQWSKKKKKNRKTGPDCQVLHFKGNAPQGMLESSEAIKCDVSFQHWLCSGISANKAFAKMVLHTQSHIQSWLSEALIRKWHAPKSIGHWRRQHRNQRHCSSWGMIFYFVKLWIRRTRTWSAHPSKSLHVLLTGERMK